MEMAEMEERQRQQIEKQIQEMEERERERERQEIEIPGIEERERLGIERQESVCEIDFNTKIIEIRENIKTCRLEYLKNKLDEFWITDTQIFTEEDFNSFISHNFNLRSNIDLNYENDNIRQIKSIINLEFKEFVIRNMIEYTYCFILLGNLQYHIENVCDIIFKGGRIIQILKGPCNTFLSDDNDILINTKNEISNEIFTFYISFLVLYICRLYNNDTYIYEYNLDKQLIKIYINYINERRQNVKRSIIDFGYKIDIETDKIIEINYLTDLITYKYVFNYIFSSENIEKNLTYKIPIISNILFEKLYFLAKYIQCHNNEKYRNENKQNCYNVSKFANFFKSIHEIILNRQQNEHNDFVNDYNYFMEQTKTYLSTKFLTNETNISSYESITRLT